MTKYFLNSFLKVRRPYIRGNFQTKFVHKEKKSKDYKMRLQKKKNFLKRHAERFQVNKIYMKRPQ